MAKSDAEVTLRVNMPPPNEFKRQLKEFEKLAEGAKASLNGFGDQIHSMAEGVRIMGERAKATGSAAMVKSVEGLFSEGYGKAAAMGTSAKQHGKGIAGLEVRAQAAQKALSEGSITDEQAVAYMNKLLEKMRETEQAVSDLNYTYEVTKMDMVQAAPTDEMLGQFEKFCDIVIDAKNQSYEFADGLKAQADALADEADALDASAPGYEQARAKLMQLEKEYRQMEASARSAGDSAKGAIDKVKEAFEAYDGTEEARKKVADALKKGYEQAAAADAKLGKVEADRAMREQKRAAGAEKEAEKEAERARKEAEREAEKARKEAERAEAKARREAELAAQREAREAAAAKRDEERAERERFAMELSLLSKDQLIKKTKELQAAREAAAAAGDHETYEKRTREFMQAREQMEKVNAQLNLTRMAWSEQSQMANRFAGSITNVVSGLSNIGEQAEEGQLDLVGLASGAQEAATALVSMVQMGLGPLGLLTLALQGIQLLWNKHAEDEKERAESSKIYNENWKETNELIKTNREEWEALNRQRANSRAVKELVKDHQWLNRELEMEIANIEKAAEAELYRLGLNDDEAAHRMRMKQAELQRQLTSGQISQEQYDEQMAQLQFDRDVERLGLGVKQAEVEAKRARAVEQGKRDVYQKHAAKVADIRKQKKGMEWTEDDLREFAEGRQRNAKRVAETEAEYERLKKEHGEDDWRTYQARHAMYRAADVMAEYEVTGREMLDEYFGEGQWKSLDEGLAEYAQKLERVNGLLEAAEDIRVQAEAALEAAVVDKERAEQALEHAQTEFRVGKGRLEESFASDKRTRELTRAEKKKSEKRQRRLADLRNKADELTEKELEDRLTKARADREGATNEHERQFADSLVELYRGRLKGRRETDRERLERVNNATDLLDADGRRAMRGFDGKGLLNIMDDGRVSKGELAKLRKAYEVARKAEHEEAMAMIREIVRDALESKKQSAKSKRVIKEAFEL